MLEPNIRMLVVEDQGELRHTIVEMLKRMGASMVHNAGSGPERGGSQFFHGIGPGRSRRG